MASDGGSVKVAPGVTTFGSGDQTSVSSGLGFGGCWASAGRAKETNVNTTRERLNGVVIFGLRIHRGSQLRQPPPVLLPLLVSSVPARRLNPQNAPHRWQAG